MVPPLFAVRAVSGDWANKVVVVVYGIYRVVSTVNSRL